MRDKMDAFTELLRSEKNSHGRQFQIQSHHIQFQTNDSQASDTSYESSLSSNQQQNLGNAQYFREQMSRFFINYPQLLNHQLIGNKTNQKSLWGDLANDIINETKQEPISLQSIAKRIAFYRQKTQQIDIIDLIVKQKDLILKQLDEQAKMSSQQNINIKPQQRNNNKKSTLNGQSNEGIYYSWKKKHQAALINDSRKNSQRKLQSASLHTKKQQSRQNLKQRKFNSTVKSNKINDVQHKLTKNSSISSLGFNNRGLTKRQNSKIVEHRKETEDDLVEQKKYNSVPNSPSSKLKSLLKFEPKTDVAKQLLQQIKRHDDLNDEIGIKKIIVNFLYNHRQNVKKDILEKSSLNQKLTKLHIDDSKELLLFCPIKKNLVQTELPLNAETASFLQILKQISSGHLMKYWKLLQQKKL